MDNVLQVAQVHLALELAVNTTINLLPVGAARGYNRSKGRERNVILKLDMYERTLRN